MENINKYPYFSYEEQLLYLFRPISSQINIKPCIFQRNFPNQSRLMIAGPDKFIDDYFRLEFYKYGLFEKQPQTYVSGFHMWDHLPYDPHRIYEYERIEYGRAHGLTIIQQHETHCDSFVFAPDLHNDQANNFYLNQKELFLNYIDDFYDSFKSTLKELANHTVFVPNHTEDYADLPKPIPARQQSCASLMAKGLTTKEIARLLGISPRTVEHHINMLKENFNAKNRPHLLSILKNHPLI